MGKLSPIARVQVMNAIYGLAGSFVGIFIPIYLLRHNLDPGNVFGFYIVYTVAILLFFFVANWIVSKLGLRKTVLFCYPFLFLYFFLLYTLDQYGTPLFILALVSAFQASLYWFPLHMWLSGISKDEKRGSDLGNFFALSETVGLFAPAISGFVVLYFGFKTLFLLSGAIYLFSIIPVLSLPEFPFKEKIEMKRFIKLLGEYKKYVVAEIFENIREDAEAIIWPVFVYLSFRNVLSVGYVGTISGIGSILFIWLVGRQTDKSDKMKLLAAGGVIMAAIWGIRYFVATPIPAYALTLAAAFFAALILIPLNVVVYGTAQREGAPTFILFREFAVTIGRVLLYVFAFLVISNIRYIFIFTALACIGLVYLSRKNLAAKTAL